MLPRWEHVRACDALGVGVALFVYGLGLENFVVFKDFCYLGNLRV